MAKITWTDKATIDPRPDIPAVNKLTAADINAVKTSVNAAYDEIGSLESDHLGLESDFIDHKTNTSNPHEVTASQLPDLQSKIDDTTNPIKQDVADLEANKVDKETGKRLMTDAEGAKLQGIETGAEVNTVDPTDLANMADDYNGKLAGKVDKVTGQRLMSNAEGTKLAGIEAGAQVNTVVPSDLTPLQNKDEKGQSDGYAGLDINAKIPTSQLPSAVLGTMRYQSAWNADTNTPSIPAATESNRGFYYVVSVSGSTNIDGITDWKVGDWIVSNGTTWDKIDNTDQVTSVQGKKGSVELDASEIPSDDGNIQSDIDGLQATDVTLQENINAEAIARGNADVALQEDIDTRLPIDGISKSYLPTSPSPDGWYTVAETSTQSRTIGDFGIHVFGNGEFQLIRFTAGVSFNTNPFINLTSKTNFIAALDIKGIRILTSSATGDRAKLQVQLQDSSLTEGIVRLYNYEGPENVKWNGITPILENSVAGYTVGCELNISGNTDTQQTSNHYVLNDKRVLNTDDLSDINNDISGKEDAFSKNTAFNKNFGTTAGTVKEGNYQPTWSQVSGKPLTFTPNKNSSFDNIEDTVIVLASSSINFSEGNIFSFEILADTVFSITSTSPKRGQLIVTIAKETVSSITFSGTNVYYDSPSLEGSFFPLGSIVVFNMVSDGTKTIITRLGTFAK